MEDIAQEFKSIISQYEEGLITAEEFVNKMLDEAAIQSHRLAASGDPLSGAE